MSDDQDDLRTVTIPGGSFFRVPKDMPEARVEELQNEKFEETIDRVTGAPAWLRQRVGSSPNPADRLSTIRKFAPQSWSYGDDNFVFVHPETQNLTLYNPSGFDFGDVASVSGDIAAGIGGVAGGAAGAVLGGPVGAVAGGAGGTMAARFLAESAMRDKADPYATVDTRSPLRRGADISVEGSMAAMGDMAGRSLPAAVKVTMRGAGPVAKEAQSRFADAKSIGVDLPLGDLSRRRWVQWSQSAAADMFGGGRIAEVSRKATKKIDALTKSPVGKFTPQEGGASLQLGSSSYLKRFQTIAGRKFDQALNGLQDLPVAPANTAVATSNVMQVIGADLPQTGALLTPSLYRALQTDIANGAAPRLSTMRALRTEVGEKLTNPMLIDDAGRGQLKKLYGALTDDIRAAIPPSRLPRFDQANQFYRDRIGFVDDTLQKLAGQGVTPEQAYTWAMGQSGAVSGGGSRLASIRQGMKAPEWDVFVSAVLGRMGRKGDDFDPSKLIRDFDAMSPEAKNVLFNTSPTFRGLRPPLERSIKVLHHMRDGGEMYNRSRTGPTIYWMSLLSGGGMAGALADGVEGAAFGGAFGLMTPWMLAKLWTNPTTVRWMIQPVAKNGFMAHVGRLSAIVASEPDMEGPIRELLDVLSVAGGPPEQSTEGAK